MTNARNLANRSTDFVSVRDFGARGDGVTDDTAAIVAAHTASKCVDYPPGRYLVTMQNSAALVTYTSQEGVRITGRNATIYDPRVYTGDPQAPVFDFVTCTDVQVVGLNYEGAALASPSTQLGYLGATFVRWRNGSTGLKVSATLENARYGVLSGAYADVTYGNCANVEVDLTCTSVGYPIALYYLDGIKARIYATNVHRAAYLAGVSSGSVHAYWKNQYIADIAVLLTDALTSATPTLKGCSNMDIVSIDTGSTVFQSSSACCGITNSRQTAAIDHQNLTFRFGVKSTNTVSTNVGGFKVYSGTLPGGEPYYWEPTTVLRNIRVSGTIDRTGQTVDSNAAGDIYWRSIDTGVHTATVSNIAFEGVVIVPSSGTTRNCYFEASGLQDTVAFRDFVSSGAVGISVATAVGTRVVLENSKLPALVSGGTVGSVELNNSTVTTFPATFTTTGSPLNGSTVNGAGMTLRYKETTLTLSGASTSWASTIPSGAVVMGCVSRIQTDITGATGYLLGVAADTSRWANTNNLTAGLTTTPTNYGAAGLAPQIYQSATSIVVTAKTSNFTGGTLKVGLFYFDTTGATV